MFVYWLLIWFLAKHLVSVKSINLVNNQQFHTNKTLHLIRMSGNSSMKMTELPAKLFANLSELQEVWINDYNLTSIPENLLNESFNLQNISLAHNQLEEIPANLFVHQTKLLNLDLSYNEIVLLDDRLFNGTKFLRVLHLSFNRLQNISRYEKREREREKILIRLRNFDGSYPKHN